LAETNLYSAINAFPTKEGNFSAQFNYKIDKSFFLKTRVKLSFFGNKMLSYKISS